MEKNISKNSTKSSSKLTIDEDFKENESTSRFTLLINRIGEAVSESETLYEFVKKVFHIMFYTRFILACTLFYLVYHITIAYNGKRFSIVYNNNIKD
jgi:hypothetical protein